MMPLSIAGMGFAAALGIPALAPCRAQTFDPGVLDRTAEERNAAKVPGKPITPRLPRIKPSPSRGACWCV